MERLRINNTQFDEEWRDIPGYEGLYQVSNLGRVKSLPRNIIRCDRKNYPHREVYLKFHINQWGYYVVPLTTGLGTNKQKKHMVHRLVALAFIPNPCNYSQVNHKDGNKSNNTPYNLEWCTNSMNQLHAWKNGLNRYTGKNDVKVVQMDDKENVIKVWNSMHEAERNLPKVHAAHIWGCVQGKRKSCGGYKWKYYEED
jgi:hypothetical protein